MIKRSVADYAYDDIDHHLERRLGLSLHRLLRLLTILSPYLTLRLSLGATQRLIGSAE